jgi:hypothetical protein
MIVGTIDRHRGLGGFSFARRRVEVEDVWFDK